MVKLSEILTKVDLEKKEIEKLRPIKPEYLKKIRDKFRLEFNFHSNHIEGNNLTVGETKSLITFGLQASISKKLLDIEQMRNHIQAYDEFLTDKIKTKDSLPLELNQTFIRNLHQKIFVADQKEVVFEAGVEKIVTKKAGEYKSKPNSVKILETKEIFEYAQPFETQEMMTTLVDWYNQNREKLHPLILASLFHYKFIRIHPFDDGNGRMARFLMNMILQSGGHTLVLIRSDEENRNSYLNSLRLTDNNFPTIRDCLQNKEEITTLFLPFIQEVAKNLSWSNQIIIKAAKGEEVQELSDIVKSAKLWAKQNLEPKDQKWSIHDLQKDSEKFEFFKQKVLRPILEEIDKYYQEVMAGFFYKSEFGELNYNQISYDDWDVWCENISKFVDKMSLESILDREDILLISLENLRLKSDFSIEYKISITYNIDYFDITFYNQNSAQDLKLFTQKFDYNKQENNKLQKLMNNLDQDFRKRIEEAKNLKRE